MKQYGRGLMIQNSIVEFYDDIYRAQPRKWANIDRDYFAFKALSSLVDPDRPGRMLDYGCGNGHTLEFFKTQWLNFRFSGVDISGVALELARGRLPEGEFYTELPSGVSWDVITLMGVAEHFPDVPRICAGSVSTCP
jgi:SAM-dependent methyltransferase